MRIILVALFSLVAFTAACDDAEKPAPPPDMTGIPDDLGGTD